MWHSLPRAEHHLLSFKYHHPPCQEQQNELQVTCTWQMKASHASPWQKFYRCLRDSPKLQKSLRSNLWDSHWMLLTHLVTHQLLWMAAGQPPMKFPRYYPIHVREWQMLRRHVYLFGCNIFSLFPHFAIPEQQKPSLLLSHLEFGVHKLYLVVGCSDSTTSTTFSINYRKA